MTSAQHRSGTDRVAEVALRHGDVDVIANIQCDQPLATPEVLSSLVGPYIAGEVPQMTTLACPLTSQHEWTDPNVVKVVCDREGYALYFSRSPIPYRAEQVDAAGLHHLGLYAFTRAALIEFASFPPTRLEQLERLEQLRALENGMAIRVCVTDTDVVEVNTPHDLKRAEAALMATGTAG
jgi:3-deoxy-manno-octulosonate cytidylyltransferase (CMP-KDO synthetase)